MILFFRFFFFNIFNKSLIAIWIVFIPGTALSLGVDGKAIEGVELYQKHMFDQASKRFFEAQQEKPNDPKISYNLGNSRYKQGSYEQALQSYSRSVEQKPSSSVNQRTQYNIGNTLFRMNKLEESIKAYKKALELDPDDMDSKFNLEFVREQIMKKKQEQNKSEGKKENSKSDSKKKKTAKDKDEKSKKEKKKDSSSNKKSPSPKNNPNQNDPKNSPSKKTKTASEKMTKEEAEQRLNLLTENLKQFQRKQALEMKSLFTYQGNDW
jgi:Ca-activated chloride channel family protein